MALRVWFVRVRRIGRWPQWLPQVMTPAANGKYRHGMVKEDTTERLQIIADLRQAFHDAHEDARAHLRAVADVNLDPLAADERDPADGYPEGCDIVTLKGYFGEVLAGLLIEHTRPFGIEGWRVPAFLFRFHVSAFQFLEREDQDAADTRTIPGRTGDDCLAFLRDEEGHIRATLFCEAKCSEGHDAHLIARAHEQISDRAWRPVDVGRLVEVLLDSPDDVDAVSWVASLRELYLLRTPPTGYQRYNMVTYVCGRSPMGRAGQTTWIPSDKPHAKYVGTRPLEAVELHLVEVVDLITAVYAPSRERCDDAS